MFERPARAVTRPKRPSLAALAVAGLAAVAVAAPAVAAPAVDAEAVDVARTTGSSPAAAAPVNLALAGTATASSVELDRADFAAAHVNDDDPSTRWSSKYQDDHWVQVELAEPSAVDHVVLEWPNACARDFVLQTSGDGVTWTDVEALQRDTCPRTDVIEVRSAGPVSFVRMQGRQRWSTWGYSISEFQVWDAPPAPPEPVLGLVPLPVSVEEHADTDPFQLARGARIMAVGDGALAPATSLAQALRPATGLALPVTPTAPEAVPDRQRGSGPAPIVVDVRPGNAPAGHADEGYTLEVTPVRTLIAADTPNGALNGVQTLRQLFPQWIESDTVVATDWTVPAVSIADYPRFAHRGVMLDVARSFYPVHEVKEYIDTAAQFKINRLHLHLTDDQGWRIAIDQPADNPSGIDYGLLTEVGGATAMTERGTELGSTGYYTKADYTEIVRYAARNGMTVIPEVDLPGHTNSALHSIPQLNTPGAKPQLQPGQTTVPHNGTGAVGYSSLDAHSAVTYEFVEHVLAEIAALTPGPYLHIGGDEAHVTSHADYVTMVDAFTAATAELGKTVVGWNEYAGTALPQDDAVVQFWNGNRAAVANAVNARGAEVVLSPAAHTYVPQKQDPRQPQGGTWACGGVCGLDRHYNWDPGTFIPGIAESSVLGVESALWGEFIRRIDQAQYYAYPRVAATAEVGWTPQDQRRYADFTRRLGELGGRLTVQGTNFFPSADVDWRVDALGAPATAQAGRPAEVTWTVTAPGVASQSLDATVTWSDGVTGTAEVSTAREASIPGMWINDAFTAVSGRVFETPGEYTGTLSVGTPGAAPVLATVHVSVRDEG
ncbi:family 20 glycosylhydrolase [Jiangella sp. DSM 45060]|uniref:family 20 glycosylhydrolase n=1 Tax=Jiangella sp. DSM 45060 TaxID=1798224 RepID=UPI00087CC7C0|nr:family 20 glycosylhydrolase [Jiangella sp. DSM 45060]SDT13701.1 Glycosyl hydrolase family 20, domain 2 [Jiangella sp. DSM 45060]